MSYTIKLEEKFFKGHRAYSYEIESKWNWTVYDSEEQLVETGTSSSEFAASSAAKQAAKLHYKEQNARVITHEVDVENLY